MPTTLLARAPHAALRGLVARDYVGWAESGVVPMRRREVPSPIVPIILNFDAPFDVDTPLGAPVSGRFGSFMAGMSDTHSFATATGPACCVQVDLTPLGAYRLLRRPLHEVTNTVVALDDLLGSAGRQLVERLGNAPSWDARFDMLDAHLRDRLVRDVAMSPAEYVWRRVRETQGRVAIGALVTETGCAPKRLIAECRSRLGLPPKALARVVRFDHAMSRLNAGVAWSTLALDAGYYDQAHMIREFNALAGCAPSGLVVSHGT